MLKQFSGLLACAAAVLTLSHSGEAAATSSTWALGTSCDPAGVQSTYVVGGNTTTCTTGIPAETATITAFANISTTSTSTATFLRASMGDFNANGIGVYSGSADTSSDAQHAFDNVTTGCGGGTGTQGAGGCGGSQEFALVNFGPYKVNLTSLSMGFIQTDADVAILRWDGADMSAAAMETLVKGRTTASLTDTVVAAGGVGTGWSLVATESMGTAYPDTSTVNLGSKVSSWWIISTYYGTTATTTSGTLNTGDDRFKLSGLTGSVCTSGSYSGGTNGNGGTCNNVSEPGSLSLALMAVVGIGAARRRFLR